MENKEVWTNEDQVMMEEETKKNEMSLFTKALIIGGGVLVTRHIYKKHVQPKIEKAFDKAVQRYMESTKNQNQDQQSNNNSNNSNK